MTATLRGNRRSRLNGMYGYPAGGHVDNETKPRRPVSKEGDRDDGRVEENPGSSQQGAQGTAALHDWNNQPF